MNNSKMISNSNSIDKNDNINQNISETNKIIVYKTKKDKQMMTSQSSESDFINKENNKENALTNWFKKNFKLKLILILCSILIIIITIILLVIFLKKDDDSNSNIDKFNSNVDSSSSKILDDSSSNNNSPKEEENEEESFIILPSNEKIIAKLNYDINEMFIYNEISKSTMKYSFDSDLSLRNLQENIDTIKNYKYLSFIYDISNTTDGVEKYSAYFTILEKSTEENGDNFFDFYNNFIDEYVDDSIFDSNSDSSNGEEDFSIKPILKASFYQNGTIDDIFYPEGVNEQLKANVINFIEKITPILSQKNYTNNHSRLLEESDDEKYIFTFEKNKTEKSTTLKEKQIEKNKDFGTFSIEDSKINTNIERVINSENKIGKITSNSETNLFSNVSNQIEKPKLGGLIDLDEDKGDENNIIKFPIDSISTNSSESMELIKNCKNETLKDFINEKIKNYNYISIKEEKNKDPKNLRLLSKIFNVNENEIHLLNNSNKLINSNKLNNYNLRNLEKYEVLQQKIIYAYTLGKTNVAGLKYEIMVVMSFIPQNGQINYKVVCRTDKIEIIIGNYEIKTNYGKLITVINQITEIFSQKILEFKNSFDLKLKEWEKNISDKLINLINAINNPINIVDIFNEPLTKLCDDIKSESLNVVYIKDLIIKTDEKLKILKEEVNKESETNTQKILQQSETDFEDFIEINDEIFNEFHKNVKELINFILDKLKGLEFIDFDCYY